MTIRLRSACSANWAKEASARSRDFVLTEPEVMHSIQALAGYEGILSCFLPLPLSPTLYYALLHSTTLYYILLHSTTLYFTRSVHSTTLDLPTLLHSTTLYYTVLHSPSCTLLHSTTLYSTTFYYTLLHSTLPHSTTLYYTPQHSTTLYCTLLHSTLLHSTTLYYTLLQHSTTLYERETVFLFGKTCVYSPASKKLRSTKQD